MSEAAAPAVETGDDDSGRAWGQESLGRDGYGRRQDGAKGHARNSKNDWERGRCARENRNDMREQQKMDAKSGMAEVSEARCAGAVIWLAAARWYWTTRTDEAVCFPWKIDPSCVLQTGPETHRLIAVGESNGKARTRRGREPWRGSQTMA